MSNIINITMSNMQELMYTDIPREAMQVYFELYSARDAIGVPIDAISAKLHISEKDIKMYMELLEKRKMITFYGGLMSTKKITYMDPTEWVNGLRVQYITKDLTENKVSVDDCINEWSEYCRELCGYPFSVMHVSELFTIFKDNDIKIDSTIKRKIRNLMGKKAPQKVVDIFEERYNRLEYVYNNPVRYDFAKRKAELDKDKPIIQAAEQKSHNGFPSLKERLGIDEAWLIEKAHKQTLYGLKIAEREALLKSKEQKTHE